MKGVVFTEFLEMVEDNFGYDVADNIIENADLPSGGAYTAVGTYHHSEMVQLVVNLSTETETPVPNLLHTYGNHLFAQFVAGYGHLFDGITDTYSFLHAINNHIHVEVRKLYPEAELPTIDCVQVGESHLELYYQSARPFADFAEGLLEGAIIHFGENITMKREDIPGAENKAAKFHLIRNKGV